MYEMDYRFNPKLVLGRKISGFDKDTLAKTGNYLTKDGVQYLKFKFS